MQEREKVSSIDIKAHLNNLRKNPKFTEEMLKLVRSAIWSYHCGDGNLYVKEA